MSNVSPLSLDAIQTLLINHYPDIQWQVSGDGYQYEIMGIGDEFSGLSKLKRQQLVYGVLNEAIADGRLHALTIHAFTPTEMEQK